MVVGGGGRRRADDVRQFLGGLTNVENACATVLGVVPLKVAQERDLNIVILCRFQPHKADLMQA